MRTEAEKRVRRKRQLIRIERVSCREREREREGERERERERGREGEKD